MADVWNSPDPNPAICLTIPAYIKSPFEIRVSYGIYMDLLMNGGWFLRPRSPRMGPAQDPQLIREALCAMPSAERETEVCPWW